MRNNEYAQRKYTLGEGANRRKKVRAGWPQNENYPAGYLGWTPVSSHVRAAEHLLFSSLRIAFVSRSSRPDRAPQRPSFYLIRRFSSRQFSRSPRPRTKHRFRLKRNNDTGSNTMKFLSRQTSVRLSRFAFASPWYHSALSNFLPRTCKRVSITRTRSRSVTQAATANINYRFLRVAIFYVSRRLIPR